MYDKSFSYLCWKSRHAFRKWKVTGRPLQGPVAEDRKKYKRDVASHINKCRARETRKQIQHWDELIQQNHPTRFKSFKKPRAECTRLLSQTGNSVITDTQELLECWADHFQSWANPNLTLTLSSKRVTNPQMNTTSSYGKQNNILDCELSVEEIEYAINHLKRGHAGGADNVSPEH